MATNKYNRSQCSLKNISDFIACELELLAQEVEDWNKKDIARPEDAATIIRAKAKELTD